MDSDTDDEPLSSIASKKRLEKSTESFGTKRKRKRKKEVKERIRVKKRKDLKLVLTLPRKSKKPNRSEKAKVVEKPNDVWLYMKDLNPSGPYSCLLCPEWFINKAKLIVHYTLNHKKDYCGICRYFVETRGAWEIHRLIHIPYRCAHCPAFFPTEPELKAHLGAEHDSVHCRLCENIVNAGQDDYVIHLRKRHLVTNMDSMNLASFWHVDYEGSPVFTCFLCSKNDVNAQDFYKHYFCTHKLPLKSFTALLSGCDVPFTVDGVNVSMDFLESELKGFSRYGYVERPLPGMEGYNGNDSSMFLQTFIKQENNYDYEVDVTLETVDEGASQDNFDQKMYNTVQNDNPIEKQNGNDLKNENGTIHQDHDEIKYTGTKDIDVMQIESIVISQIFVNYVENIKSQINRSEVPVESKVCFDQGKVIGKLEFQCPLCQKMFDLHDSPAHMAKDHLLKSSHTYSCRLCLKSFETEQDLNTHYGIEVAAFHRLYLCQFCDYEFEDRESAREHLNKHLQDMTVDNCTSPHLGYKCKFCSKLFWNEPEREEHQCVYHKDGDNTALFFSCCLCDKEFSDKIWFVHHYVTEHKMAEDTVIYRCLLCYTILNSMEVTRDHFKTIHPTARKVFCTIEPCNYRPYSKEHVFQGHVRAFHSQRSQGNLPSNSCLICTRSFPTHRSFSLHMAQAHGPGRYKCRICGDNLRSNDERNLHYMIRHPGQQPYECDLCGRSFLHKSTLYLHKSNAHSTGGAETFKCDHCGKEFTRRDSYKEHIQIHMVPRHACSYCPARFAQRSNMMRHERRHTGERPYSCVHCPRTFADKGACNFHVKNHENPEYYTCPHCSQRFLQKSKLKYHIRKHTGENMEVCPVCGKEFVSPYNLKEHMKMHERPTVSCPFCGKTFNQAKLLIQHIKDYHRDVDKSNMWSCPLCTYATRDKSAFKRHVLAHSDMKPFKCKVCQTEFSSLKSLKRHVMRVHDKGSKDLDHLMIAISPYLLDLKIDQELMQKLFGPPPSEGGPQDIVLFGQDEEMTIKPDIDALRDNISYEKPRRSKRKKKKTKAKKVKKEVDSELDNDSRSGGEELDVEYIPVPQLVTVKIERTDDDFFD